MESGKYRKELWEGFRNTTNNRMELLAVIAGLEALKFPGTEVTVVSDSIISNSNFDTGFGMVTSSAIHR